MIFMQIVDFLNQYPITRRAVWFVLGLFIVAVTASSVLLSKNEQEFVSKNKALATQSVKAVAKEIELIVSSIKRGSAIFADTHQELFLQLSRDPDDEQTINEIKRLLGRSFPEHYSFTLTDQMGQPYFDDLGESIGDLCLINIKESSRFGHPNDLVVHPGPGTYHFDIMVPWHYDGQQQGIFFKSYKLDIISRLLKVAQADGHNIVIVKKSDPDLLEVTVEGGRDVLQNSRNIRLTALEKSSIGATKAIEDSDWLVLAIYQANLFKKHSDEIFYPALLSWLVIGFVGIVSIVLINKEEKNRQKAELLLQQTNEQLEIRVAERTADIHKTNQQLEEEIRRRDKAEKTQRILQQAADQSYEIFFITDPKAQIIYANPAFSRSLGYTNEELVGQSIKIIQSGLMKPDFYQDLWENICNKKPFSGVFINQSKQGELCYMDETISPILDKNGEIEYFIANCLDITSETKHLEHINYISEHDPLTGLYNRKYLKAYIDDYITGSEDRSIAVIYLSIKRFDFLFEGLGQDKGNLVLKLTSDRLIAMNQDSHLLAKLGKDEFVWVLPDYDTADKVYPTLSALVEVFTQPVEIDKEDVTLALNIGIAFYPADASNYDQLISNSFAAHNRSKSSQESTFVFYQKGQAEATTQRLVFEREIRNAINERDIEFYYQPKVSLKDGSIVGFESLCRWREKTTGTYISPEMFIPLIEELGLMSLLCQQGIEDAANIIASVIKPLDLDLRIAINLSPAQLSNPEMVDKLHRAMISSDVKEGNLEFEITENAFIDDFSKTKKAIEKIHALGCAISLDDFGTGYSSMQYLKELPIDFLKIDKSFVMSMHENAKDRTFIKAIIAMGQGLDLKVIAEGVENNEHLKLLEEYNCDDIQGYIISKPIPGNELENWIKQYNQSPNPVNFL